MHYFLLVLALVVSHPDIFEDLNDSDSSKVASAFRRLAKSKADPTRVVAKGVELLTTNDTELADSIVQSLKDYGEEAASAVPALVNLYNRTKEPDRKALIIEALCFVNPRPSDVDKLLNDAMKSGSAIERIWSSYFICLKSKESLEPMAILIDGLYSDSHRERSLAIYVLGQLGNRADQAVPDLIKISRIGSDSHMAACVQAIGMISKRNDVAVPYLVDVICDRTIPAFIRLTGCDAIQRYKNLDNNALDGLRRAMNGTHPFIEIAAARVVLNYRFDTKARATLLKHSHAADAYTAAVAKEALLEAGQLWKCHSDEKE